MIKKRGILGFSLIELIVVVAILGLLAAIAVPAYKNHAYRAKVNAAFVVLNSIRDTILVSYNKTGSWPNSITYGNVTINAAVNTTSPFTAINIGNVRDVRYYKINNLLYVDVVTSALNGLTETIGGTPYTYSNSGITIAVLRSVVSVPSNGAVSFYCGRWSSTDTNDVPAAYLPANCNCVNLSTVFMSGFLNSPC